jgi:O-antigen ligase
MSWLPVALVTLLAAVAWDWGGYDPWAVLGLELGTAALILLLAWRGAAGQAEDAELTERRYEAWKRLPFWVRHPELAAVVRALTLGGYPRKRSSGDVEILLPGSEGRASVELDLAKEGFLFGHRVRRTGLLAPIALLTVWIGLSLVPLGRTVLSGISPDAATLRAEAEALVGETPSAAPWSLAPYQSLRGLWLWMAIAGFFFLSFRAARTNEGARRLSLGLLLVGAASGFFGIGQFLAELRSASGVASEALRASGTFGNPNHFAAFQSMLLLSSLGFFTWLRAKAGTAPRGQRSNEGGLAGIAGLGIIVIALSLLLSLSRSGIASALAGTLVFAALSRSPARGGRTRHGPFRWLAAIALAIGAVFLWIGVEPLVGRFTGLAEQWNEEATRIQVWRDSVPAVSDFWMTGSGLSSFRYVTGRYRTFGGRIFYSWAHNDYLQVAIELGLPGIVLVVWLSIAVVRAARRVRRELAQDRTLSALHTGFVSALVVVALHSLADFSLHLPANLALCAALAGAVVGMERREPEAASGAGSLRRRPSQ